MRQEAMTQKKGANRPSAPPTHRLGTKEAEKVDSKQGSPTTRQPTTEASISIEQGKPAALNLPGTPTFTEQVNGIGWREKGPVEQLALKKIMTDPPEPEDHCHTAASHGSFPPPKEPSIFITGEKRPPSAFKMSTQASEKSHTSAQNHPFEQPVPSMQSFGAESQQIHMPNKSLKPHEATKASDELHYTQKKSTKYFVSWSSRVFPSNPLFNRNGQVKSSSQKSKYKSILISPERRHDLDRLRLLRKAKRRHVHFFIPQNKRMVFLRIMDPHSRGVQVWLALMVFPLVYETWSLPYRLALEEPSLSSGLLVSDAIADAFMVVSTCTVPCLIL
jgi:hypothetical protein